MSLVNPRAIIGMDEGQPGLLVLARLLAGVTQNGEVFRASRISLFDEIELPIGRAGGLQRQFKACLKSLQGFLLLLLEGYVLNRSRPGFGSIPRASIGLIEVEQMAHRPVGPHNAELQMISACLPLRSAMNSDD